MNDSIITQVSQDIIQDYVNKRLITCRKHPKYELYILNYTPECQFTRQWDDFTLACRGLIVDNYGKVVARPFKKFFNYGEHESPNVPDLIPTENFKVYDKLDGSLGILYHSPEGPRIATRGSFESPQAQIANEILDSMSLPERYFNKNYTYLFEIIYPENRIVVNYGTQKKLVLIAAIKTNTGNEIDLICTYLDNFEYCKRYFVDDWQDVPEVLSHENKEGVVVLFENGQRVKIKFQEYLKLHRLVTGVNEYRIWECMSTGIDVMEMIKDLPDEYHDKVNTWRCDLQTKFNLIRDYCEFMLGNLPTDLMSRKEIAEYFKKTEFPGILFLMYDGKEYENAIWKLIKPKVENGDSIKERE